MRDNSMQQRRIFEPQNEFYTPFLPKSIWIQFLYPEHHLFSEMKKMQLKKKKNN